MNTALVTSEAIELFSRITGQKLSQKTLTPSVIFLAALVTVLLGVMLADGAVTDQEKQRWQKSINKFIPPEGNVRQLTQVLTKGVRQNQVYKKLNDLLTLTAPLSESERLLLIGFGYEMSAADGVMDAREKKYLEVIAYRLGINPQHLAVLEAGFTNQGTVELSTLDEVRFLLAPDRFHELDTTFVKAARDMLAALSIKPEHKGTQQQRASSYEELKEFQKYRQQLDNFCYQFFQIIQDCNNRNLLPHTLADEIGKISQKLQYQRFRLAVIGEFSSGKSTLLNALLGEEIQPVRAIPCSGTVTVLRYGTQKRVVCRYRDGREEEIPFDQYQEKAAIPEEAALGNLSYELAQSAIEEIIFEHPDLDLCSSGVEIVDSPGLNDHPERTAITQKLLQSTDAAIFLINASRPLTQGERELLNDLRKQLSDQAAQPASNLFVLVNFMDLLRKEKDRQQVRKLVENFLQGQNSIIAGENRVHFISAQAALDAILQETEDEYLTAFQNFTQSIEKFLTMERGSLELKQAITKIDGLIQSSLDGLHQSEAVLNGKVNLSEADKQKILEQIGEVSACDVRIRVLANDIREQVFEQVNESWEEWIEGLTERLANKIEQWSSNHNPILAQQEVMQDYVNQFIRDLQEEIDEWGSKQLRDEILNPHFDILDDCIQEELEKIKGNLSVLDEEINANFCSQINLEIGGIEGGFGNLLGYIGGGLFGGGLGAGLLALIGIGGPIALAVVGVGAAIAGAVKFGLVDGIYEQIKLKVFQVGCEKFFQEETIEKLGEKIGETIGLVFDKRVEAATNVVESAIFLCENILEQQEKAHKETQEQREAEKAWIAQKRQELEQVQKNIESILPC